MVSIHGASRLSMRHCSAHCAIGFCIPSHQPQVHTSVQPPRSKYFVHPIPLHHTSPPLTSSTEAEGFNLLVLNAWPCFSKCRVSSQQHVLPFVRLSVHQFKLACSVVVQLCNSTRSLTHSFTPWRYYKGSWSLSPHCYWYYLTTPLEVDVCKENDDSIMTFLFQFSNLTSFFVKWKQVRTRMHACTHAMKMDRRELVTLNHRVRIVEYNYVLPCLSQTTAVEVWRCSFVPPYLLNIYFRFPAVNFIWQMKIIMKIFQFHLFIVVQLIKVILFIVSFHSN